MSAFFGAQLFLGSGGELADPQFHRLVARFHKLGPRACAEFLAEIGAARMLRHVIEERLTEYVERLDRKTLAALGGDRLPPVSIHSIPDDEQGGQP